MTTIKIFIINLLLLIFLVNAGKARCASTNDSTNYLKIGQKVPDLDIYYSNYGNKKVNLSEFRGKSIILDLWTVTCAPCIESMPKTNALQEKFKDKLQILYVTADENEKVEKLKIRSDNVRLNKIPSLTNSKYFTALFKHFSFPTYIWIDSDGYVKHITNGGEITEETIRDFVAGKHLALKEKKDIKVNRENPYLVEWYPYEKNVSFYTYLQPFNTEYSSTGGWGIRRDSENYIQECNLSFAPLSTLYALAFGFGFFDDLQLAENRIIETFPRNKILTNINDTVVVNQPYRFDFRTTKQIVDKQIYNHFKSLFDAYFNINSSIKKLSKKCFVLKRYPKNDQYKTKGGIRKGNFNNHIYTIHNVKWATFKGVIKREPKPYEIFDETGILDNESVDISIDLDLGDLKKLNKYLNNYGLFAEEEQRELDCIILEHI
jgi:thiol-disulfide isomerase/thioredoxin